MRGPTGRPRPELDFILHRCGTLSIRGMSEEYAFFLPLEVERGRVVSGRE
jgi:hypothetical protein